MILMECVALTGISKWAINDLISNGIKTMEIRSPYNFFTLLHTSPGDVIFLTEASAPDIVVGTSGLLATIKAIQVVTHRLIQAGADFYEEREAEAARAQLVLLGQGRVRSSKGAERGSPLALEVDEVCYYDAG